MNDGVYVLIACLIPSLIAPFHGWRIELSSTYVLFFDISRLSHAVWGGKFIICSIISTISNYVVSVCLLLQLCRDWYGIWEQWTLRPEDIPSVEDTKAYQIPACSTETVCGDGSHLGQRSLVLRPSATIYVYIQVFGFIHINVILI